MPCIFLRLFVELTLRGDICLVCGLASPATPSSPGGWVWNRSGWSNRPHDMHGSGIVSGGDANIFRRASVFSRWESRAFSERGLVWYRMFGTSRSSGTSPCHPCRKAVNSIAHLTGRVGRGCLCPACPAVSGCCPAWRAGAGGRSAQRSRSCYPSPPRCCAAAAAAAGLQHSQSPPSNGCYDYTEVAGGASGGGGVN